MKTGVLCGIGVVSPSLTHLPTRPAPVLLIFSWRRAKVLQSGSSLSNQVQLTGNRMAGGLLCPVRSIMRLPRLRLNQGGLVLHQKPSRSQRAHTDPVGGLVH